MNSNQFAIVPCSVCPDSTLLKTALIWNQSTFCSPQCLSTFVDAVRVNNEPAKKAAHDKFFNLSL